MKLYVVANQISGYAREDAHTVNVVGAYTMLSVAKAVKSAAGFGATISEIEVDYIYPGHRDSAIALGFKLPASMAESSDCK